MVKFEPGNLFKMPQLLKIPELVSKHYYHSSTFLKLYFLKGMAYITMMVARLAPYKSPLTYETESLPIRLETVDATITLQMVVYGFVMIALVQLLGIFGGDRAPVQVGFRHKKKIASTNVFYRIFYLVFVDLLCILALAQKRRLASDMILGLD